MKLTIFSMLLLLLSGCSSSFRAANTPSEPTVQVTDGAQPDADRDELKVPYTVAASFDEMGRETYRITVPSHNLDLLVTASGRLLIIDVFNRGGAVFQIREGNNPLLNLPAKRQ